MQRCFQGLVFAGMLSVVACGGRDATAPGSSNTLSAQDALASLSRGWASLGSGTSPEAGFALLVLPAPDASQAPPLDRITVTVDGTQVQMFGIVRRVAYPAGTCFETLLGIPSFGGPATCTIPPGALAMVLWQATSASRAPDRIIVVMADVGTSQFASLALIEATFNGGGAIPAIGLYIDSAGALWGTSGGSLTSTVTSTAQTCTMMLPIFAKSATCNLGSFSESGSLMFAPIDIGSGTPTGAHSITLSAQQLNGVIQTVTATEPITIPAG